MVYTRIHHDHHSEASLQREARRRADRRSQGDQAARRHFGERTDPARHPAVAGEAGQRPEERKTMIAAVYARKSTDQSGVADDQKSVARQVEHARAYAARKDWTVAGEHVYVDDGISGAEFERRPGYMRLLNALGRRAPFQVLIVSELSRLGREQL